ncbi:hypothetical protein B0A56_07210 [Flavobacterium columnare NBRC 100251 = ATCC 23463]|nr:hypothetical protein B0A56_07210 [Flavobacterium columnare NBRC 100251 = ATCC 23463]
MKELQILLVVLVFVSYYFLCFLEVKKLKLLVLPFFIVSSIVLRLNIDITLNKDYYGYYYGYSLSDFNNIFDYFLKEPYLYIQYSFLKYLNFDHDFIFVCVYGINFILVSVFFIWLAFLNDLSAWRKNILFTLYYFLFGYVLLRNGPSYAIFSYFIYYSIREIKKSRLIFLTPFMHISSVLPLGLYFSDSKRYFKILFLFSILASLIIIFILPYVESNPAFDKIFTKASTYSEELEEISIFHYIYFGFMFSVFILQLFFLRKKVYNPFLITTFIIYLLGFFVNPVVGFRLSPYFLISSLFYKVENYKNLDRILNIFSFFLVLYFILTLKDSHYL